MNGAPASPPMRPGVPVLFEALPGPAADAPAMQEAHIDALRPVRALGIDGLLVPEIINGQYATVAPRRFAAALRQATGLPTSVACITVQRDAGALDAWADEAASDGLGALLVGGESSAVAYPGLGVTAAVARVGTRLPCSVVTIPTRRRSIRDEPQRLLEKQRAGAVQAVSQILYEPRAAQRLQADLRAASDAAGTPPLPLVWSLAPVVRKNDIAFLEWLGVDIPRATRQRLLDAGTPDQREARSLGLCEDIARGLLGHAEAEDTGPIGFCIEHVRQNNVDAAFRLVERVREVVRDHGGAPRPAITLGRAGTRD